jgi:hypothetical protein
MTELNRPRVRDDDRGSVIITWQGRQIRGYSYQNDDERRKKMMYAREYIEGWCDGRDHGHDEGYNNGYSEGRKEQT